MLYNAPVRLRCYLLLYVLDHRRENPELPDQTTGDQVYDEAQFEAYRALGESAEASIFGCEITGPELPDTD